VTVGTLLLTSPLYIHKVRYVKEQLKGTLLKEIDEGLQIEKPIPKITQSFLKTVVVDTLKEDPIKRSGINFTLDLIKE
jgi:hypothetical protein